MTLQHEKEGAGVTEKRQKKIKDLGQKLESRIKKEIIESLKTLPTTKRKLLSSSELSEAKKADLRLYCR